MSTQLVRARTLYYQSLAELGFRLSESGMRFHDGASVLEQWNLVLEMREYIQTTFNKSMPLPKDPFIAAL